MRSFDCNHQKIIFVLSPWDKCRIVLKFTKIECAKIDTCFGSKLLLSLGETGNTPHFTVGQHSIQATCQRTCLLCAMFWPGQERHFNFLQNFNFGVPAEHQFEKSSKSARKNISTTPNRPKCCFSTFSATSDGWLVDCGPTNTIY